MKARIFVLAVWFVLTVPVYALAQTPAPYLSKDGGLAWDANTEPDLAGYMLHIGPASEQYTIIKNVGNVTSISRDALALPDGMYFAAVKAYDLAKNESGFSNEVTFRIDTVSPKAPGLRLVLEKLIAFLQALLNATRE